MRAQRGVDCSSLTQGTADSGALLRWGLLRYACRSASVPHISRNGRRLQHPTSSRLIHPLGAEEQTAGCPRNQRAAVTRAGVSRAGGAVTRDKRAAPPARAIPWSERSGPAGRPTARLWINRSFDGPRTIGSCTDCPVPYRFGCACSGRFAPADQKRFRAVTFTLRPASLGGGCLADGDSPDSLAHRPTTGRRAFQAASTLWLRDEQHIQCGTVDNSVSASRVRRARRTGQHEM